MQGVSGERPSARQMLSRLRTHNMFVYCGHGSGEQYVPLALMRQLRGGCAAALLVGCSSGRLRLCGTDYDPAGAVISYLLSGRSMMKVKHCLTIVSFFVVLCALLISRPASSTQAARPSWPTYGT